MAGRIENKKYKLMGLLGILKGTGRNYDLLMYSPGVYVICDMDDNQRDVKRGSLEFLIGFCEGLLYVD